MIKVAILEDHQSTIDGYHLRLAENAGIRVVASCFFSECLLDMLENNPVDILILDINVPISRDNQNIQPIHQLIPELKSKFPDLIILVISMYAQRAMIKAIYKAGTSGYILKDDYDSIRNLGKIVETLVDGGIYMSNRVRDIIINAHHNDFNLTQRELEVLSICGAYPDESTAEIAERMGIANSTVRNFLHKIYLKLQVHGRASAILKAQEIGLLPGIASKPNSELPL